MQITNPGSVEEFISLKDFILGKSLAGDHDDVQSRFLLIHNAISRVSYSAIATQSASTFEYVLDVLQRNMHRATLDFPQSLLGGFSVMQLLTASGRMDYWQRESCIKLLTGGICFDDNGVHFRGNDGAQFFELNREAIKLNVREYLTQMTVEDLVKMKPQIFDALNWTLNHIDGKGRDKLDSVNEGMNSWLSGAITIIKDPQTHKQAYRTALMRGRIAEGLDIKPRP